MRWIMWYCGIYIIIIYIYVFKTEMNISPTITIWISPHDIPIMVGYCWWNSHFCFWTPLIDTVKYHIVSCISTISPLYIYFLFFLNAGSAIFVHWSRANTLMVQRSFLPAEDWRTSTMILLLKTTFLLIERTTTFCCHNLPAWITFFPFFLSKNLGNHQNFAVFVSAAFSAARQPPWVWLNWKWIRRGTARNCWVNLWMFCWLSMVTSVFLAGFGDHIQKWNFRWGIQATWEFHQQNMWVAIHSGFNSGTLR